MVISSVPENITEIVLIDNWKNHHITIWSMVSSYNSGKHEVEAPQNFLVFQDSRPEVVPHSKGIVDIRLALKILKDVKSFL